MMGLLEMVKRRFSCIVWVSCPSSHLAPAAGEREQGWFLYERLRASKSSSGVLTLSCGAKVAALMHKKCDLTVPWIICLFGGHQRSHHSVDSVELR